MKMHRRVGALASIAVLAALLVPAGPAQAQEQTFDISIGQEFFGQGVPGFSNRFYPGSVRVHEGDTLHFMPGFLQMGPQGTHPQQYFGENDIQVGNPGGLLDLDSDEGPDALRFNLDHIFFGGGDVCGTVDNPCAWGSNAEFIVPTETEGFDVYAVVDAPAGTTLWASAILPNSDVNSNFKIEVVPADQATSTQEELDARAARLAAKDYEDALALHSRMSAKKTSHINAAGKKVFDVFIGAAAGPIEMFASYPKRTKIKRGQRVQFHFMYQGEVHTATFGGDAARDVFFNLFVPGCDPDGDGTAEDLAPVGFDPETETPLCPEGSNLEADVHDLAPWAVGDGKMTGATDYENSGFIFPKFPEEGTFDVNPDPWTVRFPKTTNKKGFKFICLIHGGFMGGRVVVK